MIGARPTQNHPVAATFFKQAAKRGVKIIIIDPMTQEMSRFATWHLQFKPGTGLATVERLAAHHHR